MSTPEAESYAELIADCADIPAALHGAAPEFPIPRAAAPWTVDDATFEQVDTMEEYV